MPRAKRGTKRHQRVKKIRDRAEGFVLGRGGPFKQTKQAVIRSGVYAYIGRKQRKRNFRSLWITRLSAAANQNEMSYSRLIGALLKSEVKLNRKMLSDIAITDPSGFSSICNEVRSAAPAH